MKTTITTNLKIVSFLDVTFNLCTKRYQPSKKPHNTLIYIKVNLNHLTNIIKALPGSILKRISNVLLFNKATFDTATPFYNDIQSASGYKENLPYQKDLQRNIIWLNPPYSMNVETHTEKTFLKLTDIHSPKASKFHKIFNRNNVKVSYSFLANFTHMIKSDKNRIFF